jgi:hypothetical protein
VAGFDFLDSSFCGFLSLERRDVFFVLEPLGQKVLLELWEPFFDPPDQFAFDNVVVDS